MNNYNEYLARLDSLPAPIDEEMYCKIMNSLATKDRLREIEQDTPVAGFTVLSKKEIVL